MDNGLTILGLLAGFLTTISFLPQVLKAWSTRSTKDVSLGMFLVLALGIVLWIVYGVVRDDIPVTVGNCISLVLVLIILGLKIKYG